MRRRIPVLLLAASLAACEPPPPRETLDAHELHLQVQQLASVAAEADLFLDELAAGHLDRSFAWVQQQSLGELTDKAASELARPAPTALQAAQRQAVQGAGELRLAVSRMAQVQDDPAALNALRHELAGLQQRLRRGAGVSAP
jgi:hypothetical protein